MQNMHYRPFEWCNDVVSAKLNDSVDVSLCIRTLYYEDIMDLKCYVRCELHNPLTV